MIAALLVVTTVLSYALGWLIGWPPLVPVLNTAASYPFMIAALRRGDLRDAVARMLVWAFALGACATVLSYARPAATDVLFLRGAAYRAEMFAWVMTGRGAESTPSLFIPQQLAHAAIFSALAVATAGALAMPMGAVLMNYMGHYVGALAAASAHPAATMVLAWVPWAVIRVASFVVLGVVLAVPLVTRVDRRVDAGRPIPNGPPDKHISWGAARPLVVWAIGGLIADIVIKALLAPAWQPMLRRVVGW